MSEANRVYVNTATAGTGTVTLGTVVSAQFNTFADAGIVDGAKIESYILEQGTDFEIGVGTYSASGPSLSRDKVRISRIAGVVGTTKLTLSGAATVRVIAAAEDLLIKDSNTGGLPAGNVTTAKPYLGQVATRSFIPRLFSSTNKQMMSRSRHRAADSITSLQIALPNWMVDFTVSNGEAGVGATATVTASIEYPVGTFTQVKFSGSATGSISNGSTLLSDAVNVVIPENAFFFVRFYYTNTAGIPYQDQTGDDANGEALTYGVSGIVDQTMSGTVVQTTANYHASPCAIVAMTQKPTIMIVGASNVYGSGDTHDDTSGDLGSIARSIGPSLAYINASARGDLADWFVNNAHTQRLALKAYCTHVIFGLGRNDVASWAHTAAQTLLDLRSLWALFPDKLLYQITLEPTSSSTDAWATTVNQTTDATNAQRILLNASIRAAPAPLVNYIEIADLYETARDSGIWKATGGAWTPEGVHGNAIAQAYVRNSRTVDPAVITQSPFAVPGITQALIDLKAPLIAPGFTGPARITGTLGLAIGANLAPDAPLTVNSNTAATVAPVTGVGVHTVGADGVANVNVLDAFGNNNVIYFRQANGTLGSKTASSVASNIAALNYQGWDATGYFTNAQIAVWPTETWSVGAHGTNVRVRTTPNGSTTLTDSTYFQNSGGVSIGAAAIANDPGVGALSVSGALTVIGGGSFAANPVSLAGTTVVARFLAPTGSGVMTGQFYGNAQFAIQAFIASGTSGSPGAAGSGNLLNLQGLAWDGAEWGSAGNQTPTVSLRLRASQAQSVGAHGSEIVFDVTANGTATRVTAMTLQNSGGLSLGGTSDPGVGNISTLNAIQVGSFTVATLPSGVTGRAVWCSNCRVFNGAGVQEGAGVGTGGWVTYNGSAWKIAGTNVTAVA